MDKLAVTVDGCFYQGTTNIKGLSKVYFSIRKKKFVKPARRLGDRVSGWWKYMLLTGYYFRVSYDEWNKRNPAIKLRVEMVEVREEEVKVLKWCEFAGENRDEVMEVVKKFEVPMIEDIIGSVPGYHVPPDIVGLSKKIYRDCEVWNLFELVNQYNNETIMKTENE